MSYKGYSSISRREPLNFKALYYKGFYPGYFSRFSDSPPVHGVNNVLYLLDMDMIPSEQLVDLSQWVFETAGDFMRNVELDRVELAMFRDKLWGAGAVLASKTDYIFRRMRSDNQILPLKVIDGWWKESDVNTVSGWIVASPVATTKRILSNDSKWPHQNQGVGMILDVGLSGCISIAYSMRQDDEGHHNVYGIPVYLMAEYLDSDTERDFKFALKNILKYMASIEAKEKDAVESKITEEKAAFDSVAKERKPGHVPKESKSAKYEIGMFG